MPLPEDMAETVVYLAKAIASELAGRDPFLQGAALADAVAIYFAGHHPSVREDAILAWVDAMRALILVNEKLVLAHYGDVWAKTSN